LRDLCSEDVGGGEPEVAFEAARDGPLGGQVAAFEGGNRDGVRVGDVVRSEELVEAGGEDHAPDVWRLGAVCCNAVDGVSSVVEDSGDGECLEPVSGHQNTPGVARSGLTAGCMGGVCHGAGRLV
jgi:hypothetical protein